MISNDAILALARKYQTTELNVRREYFQQLFLSYFYRQPETDKIYFKGGTALRTLYNSPRFSEDLDFSSALSGIRAIEHAILGTLEAVERENIRAELQESKTTSGGYLGSVLFQGEAMPVLVEFNISLREGRRRGEVVTIASDYIPSYTVVALVREQLVDEKMQALLSRKKARDFYDLYFILRANLLPPKEKSILPQALKVLKQSKINFEKELKQFLPKSHWAIIRGFPKTLEKEIKQFL